MKIKLVVVALMSSLLAACDQSIVVFAELWSAHTDYEQRKVVSGAIHELTSLKVPTGEYYVDNNGLCSQEIIDKSGVNEKPLGMVDHISIANSRYGCQLKATFIDSSDIPGLSKESIILTMTDGTKTGQGDMFYWRCTFTGKSKYLMPKACQ